MINLETIGSAALVTASGGYSAPAPRGSGPLHDPYPYDPTPVFTPEYFERDRNRGSVKPGAALRNPAPSR